MTVNFYDTLGSPAQLGGDLQNFSSNGWSFTDTATHWDIVTNDVGVQQAASMVDFCVHGGVLHAVWVEPQWNGSVRVMRGPFVAKWTGAAWSALGGEVDPSLQAVTLASNPNPSGANGTHGVPARPRIVSDGTDLYVAYTVREVATAPNPPPAGVYVDGQPCGCYVTACDHTDYTVWSPRKVYVRKWNSGPGTWDLFGDLPALSNNSLPGTATTVQAFTELEAYASPGEPGAVYVAFFERGAQSAVASWVTSPACIFGIQFGTRYYAPQYVGLRVAKYTSGTGTAGTVKDIEVQTFPGGPTTIFNYFNASPNAYIGNDTGTPYVFWLDRSSGTEPFTVTDWTTLTAVQTLPAAIYGAVSPYGFTHDAATGKFYNGSSAGVFQTADDGSSPPEPLDFAAYGAAVYVPFGFPTVFTDKLVPDMSHGNLWAVAKQGDKPYGDRVQYHHECPGWADYGYVTPSSAVQGLVGETIPVMLGDVLYTVGSYRDPGSTLTDLKVKAYHATICRECANCASVLTEPYIHHHFTVTPGATGTGATGGSGPFISAEFANIVSDGVTGAASTTGLSFHDQFSTI